MISITTENQPHIGETQQLQEKDTAFTWNYRISDLEEEIMEKAHSKIKSQCQHQFLLPLYVHHGISDDCTSNTDLLRGLGKLDHQPATLSY